MGIRILNGNWKNIKKLKFCFQVFQVMECMGFQDMKGFRNSDLRKGWDSRIWKDSGLQIMGFITGHKWIRKLEMEF